MVTNRRLLIAIGIVAVLGVVVRFGLTSVTLYNEVYYSSAPDELPGFVAVEKYVCPDCEEEIREAFRARRTRDPSDQLPEGMRLSYDKPTESGFCEFHPDTKLLIQKDLPVDPRVTEGLPPETEYINREYIERGSAPGTTVPIQLTVVISQRDRRSIHRPESCLYGQGWNQIVSPMSLAVPCPGIRNGELGVRQILMDQSFRPEGRERVTYRLVVYTWYAAPPHRLTPTELSYLMQMFYDRLVNGINYRWSSVMITRRVLPGQDMDAVSERVRQFIQEFAQWAEERRADAERGGE